MDQVEQWQAKQQERIAELAEFGIKAVAGSGILGRISLSATEAEKVLKMLRRLKRLEERREKK